MPGPKKQSSSELSTLAAQVLRGKKPTQEESIRLAASVLGQDESKGQNPKKHPKKSRPKKK